MYIAGMVRQTVKFTAFKITTDLHDEQVEVTVYIKISVGVASMPEHTKVVTQLVAFANRALYVGV